jgi:hypothetical protein
MGEPRNVAAIMMATIETIKDAVPMWARNPVWRTTPLLNWSGHRSLARRTSQPRVCALPVATMFLRARESPPGRGCSHLHHRLCQRARLSGHRRRLDRRTRVKCHYLDTSRALTANSVLIPGQIPDTTLGTILDMTPDPTIDSGRPTSRDLITDVTTPWPMTDARTDVMMTVVTGTDAMTTIDVTEIIDVTMAGRHHDPTTPRAKTGTMILAVSQGRTLYATLATIPIGIAPPLVAIHGATLTTPWRKSLGAGSAQGQTADLCRHLKSPTRKPSSSSGRWTYSVYVKSAMRKRAAARVIRAPRATRKTMPRRKRNSKRATFPRWRPSRRGDPQYHPPIAAVGRWQMSSDETRSSSRDSSPPVLCFNPSPFWSPISFLDGYRFFETLIHRLHTLGSYRRKFPPHVDIFLRTADASHSR